MPATNISGISTNGVKIGIAIEETAGVKPTVFPMFHRINTTDEITIDTETIDSSALEDLVTQTIAGRGTTGGTFNVVVNMTDFTINEWTTLIANWQTAKAEGKSMWYEEWYPTLSKGFFIKIEPPVAIPKPGADQNGLATMSLPLTINEYVGPGEAIEPTDTASGA